MGIDGALLASRARGGPPTLRLYLWNRPTASLGRFQPFTDVDGAACLSRGVDAVRRATGGRGVLHDDELTYSVTASEEDGLPRGVAASYRHLGGALLEAYRLLGVPAELTAAHRGRRGSAACYLAATQADLSLAGAKLSGSAQVWRDGACLQHGSFVVTRDVAREAQVFRLDTSAAEALAAEAVTIEQAIGRRPSAEELVAAVAEGFARALGVVLEPGGLTAEEELHAARLARTARLLTGGDADVGA
jgi:lipoate-protein ligase A